MTEDPAFDIKLKAIIFEIRQTMQILDLEY